MSKNVGTNLLAVGVVLGVVAGAAWFNARKAQSVTGTPQTAPPAARPTTQPGVPQQAAERPRLVDLGAGRCQACKALAPIIDALREEYQGRLDVEFIDVWKHPDAGRPYGIRLIPTQILFDKAGKEVWRHEGFIAKKDLEAIFASKVGVK